MEGDTELLKLYDIKLYQEIDFQEVFKPLDEVAINIDDAVKITEREKALLKDTECCICIGIPTFPAISCTTCTKVYCVNCKNKLQQNKCPTC